jgi:hypothetical protein
MSTGLRRCAISLRYSDSAAVVMVVVVVFKGGRGAFCGWRCVGVSSASASASSPLLSFLSLSL